MLLVPIVVPGKTPEAFDNCAVKVLLALKVPTLVKGTETDAPVEALTQNGPPTIGVVVVMVFEDIKVPEILISSILLVPTPTVAPPTAVLDVIIQRKKTLA